MAVYVYSLKDKTTGAVIYVGRTVDPMTRLREHKLSKKFSQDIDLEILEKCSPRVASVREFWWIEHFSKSPLANVYGAVEITRQVRCERRKMLEHAGLPDDDNKGLLFN